MSRLTSAATINKMPLRWWPFARTLIWFGFGSTKMLRDGAAFQSMKTQNGTAIDVAAICLTVSFLILLIIGLTQLPKILRENRFPYRWSINKAIYRERNPIAFWFLLLVYILGSLAMIGVIVWIDVKLFSE
jgi:hypothetical protein